VAHCRFRVERELIVCAECCGCCAVLLARMELRQQIQQLHVSNEALKSSNEILSIDVVRLNAVAQHVSVYMSLLVSLNVTLLAFWYELVLFVCF